MHGTGVDARSQADAYKHMLSSAAGSGRTPRENQRTKITSEYIFGVEGFWVVAPSRHGAHNWESIGYRTADRSIQALAATMKRYSHLPQVILGHDVLTGHSMGGHGAIVAAGFRSDEAVCVAALSSWIRKEEYGEANLFFGFDAGNSYVDPDLKRVLSMAMGEGHVDHLISNMRGLDAYIRVGGKDGITHPWYSRRLHRLLLSEGVSSTYEEVPEQAHWWWDTLKANDGGVVNDESMRKYYSHCLRLSLTRQKDESEREMLLRRHREGMERRSRYDEHFSSSDDMKANTEDHKTDLWKYADRQCTSNFTLTVIYPPAHKKKCGVQVLQQIISNSRSIVHVRCDMTDNQDDHIVDWSRECVLTTSNVKRLRLWLSTGFAYGLPLDKITIHGVSVSDMMTAASEALNEKESVFIDICWHERDDKRERSVAERGAYLCRSSLHPLYEKTLQTYGPVRQVQSRPLLIVYGTPQDPQLRAILRDLAVYLSNSFLTSHHSTVQVVSDLKFKSSNYFSSITTENERNYDSNDLGVKGERKRRNTIDYNENDQESKQLMNMIFIGGPAVNKVMRKMVQRSLEPSSESSTSNHHSDKAQETDSLVGYLPDVTFGHRSSVTQKKLDTRFCVSSHCFSNSDSAAIFTFPIASVPGVDSLIDGEEVHQDMRQSESIMSSALAYCIHAVSMEGYLHMSRLAWPTVPPMVRAPFANYIPDFMVIDGSVWRKGMGGVVLAGFWSSSWRSSEIQTYINPSLSHTNSVL
mmetsp:Transcript_37189/g.37868  ORF Transcript_37189/g.37868 Transcript_37189/m.37868 type:complete len:752 (-) Transcript_37189:83-2338(-)